MPRGGGVSPLEKYSQQILALIGEQRDLTLSELVSILRKRRISASRSALSRFFARHGITFRKTISDSVRLWAQKRLRSILVMEGSGRRLFGGKLPRKKTWSMGCCARESGDAVRRSRLGN